MGTEGRITRGFVKQSESRVSLRDVRSQRLSGLIRLRSRCRKQGSVDSLPALVCGFQQEWRVFRPTQTIEGSLAENSNEACF